MNRSRSMLIVSVVASLLFAGHVTAQVVFEDSAEPAPAAPAAPATSSAAAAPAQPVGPPAVQPRPAQVHYFPPPAARASSGAAFVPGGSRAGFDANFVRGPGPDDPEMAKLSQAEHELERQSHDLMRKYSETEDQQVREKAQSALRDMLIKQFDLQNQRRELELRRVEERLSKLREQLKKRTDAREQIVNQRLEYLVNEAEGLGWTPPGGGGAGRLNFQFTPGGPRPRPAPGIAR